LDKAWWLDASIGGVRATNLAISAKASSQDTKRILHLSDLHIGLKEATLRRSYLKGHLRGLLPEIDRVVVTGDLFDTPEEGLRASFDEFRRDIEEAIDKRLLVIPGNHDLRRKGTALGRLGRIAEYSTDLDWSPFEIDDHMQTVFYSFNSCESGNFARGGVSARQRLDRAERYDSAVFNNKRIESYMKVALVHHHPVKYDSKPTALYERILAKLGGDEGFIAFEGSDNFLNWCLDRDVDLILHGHKHIPHLSTVQLDANSDSKEVTIVGCGSSVGAESKPMCYDIVSLDSNSKRWSVSFHHDERGDGSGFKLQNVALDLRVHR
jgi:predicted MPP superfamily phosphohydrolase